MDRGKLIEAIRRLAKQGYSQGEIAQHLGCTRNKIAGLGDRNGIKFSNRSGRKKTDKPGLPPFRGEPEPVRKRASRHATNAGKTGRRSYEFVQEEAATREKADVREQRRLDIIADIERLTGRPRPNGKIKFTGRSTSTFTKKPRIPDAFSTRCVWAGCTHDVYADKPYCVEHLTKSGGLIHARSND